MKRLVCPPGDGGLVLGVVRRVEGDVRSGVCFEGQPIRTWRWAVYRMSGERIKKSLWSKFRALC